MRYELRLFAAALFILALIALSCRSEVVAAEHHAPAIVKTI